MKGRTTQNGRKRAKNAQKSFALGDIPVVSRNLYDVFLDDSLVRKLHTILYSEPGKRKRRREVIGRFSGWSFVGPRHERLKRAKLAALERTDLQCLILVFGLDADIDDEDSMVDSLMDFLIYPHPSKVHTPYDENDSTKLVWVRKELTETAELNINSFDGTVQLHVTSEGSLPNFKAFFDGSDGSAMLNMTSEDGKISISTETAGDLECVSPGNSTKSETNTPSESDVQFSLFQTSPIEPKPPSATYCPHSDEILVKWNFHNGNSGKSFRIRKTNSAEVSNIYDDIHGQSMVFAGLQPDSYRFQIASIDTEGNVSVFSDFCDVVIVPDDIDVNCTFPNGQEVTTALRPDRTVSSLRSWISRAEGGFEGWEQRLFLRGKLLNSWEYFSEMNLKVGDRIIISQRRIYGDNDPKLDRFELLVKTSTDETIPVDVHETDTVDTLKALIDMKKGIPWDEQLLIVGGNKLDGSCSISEYLNDPDSIVHLVLRCRDI